MSGELQMLIEASEKKKDMLEKILVCSKQQYDIAAADEFDPELFDSVVDEKDVLLQDIDTIDQNFDRIFDRIKDEVVANKAKYKTEIAKLQELIRDILDLGAQIHAQEARTAEKMSNAILSLKKSLGQRKATATTAANYYKMSSSLQFVDPYFMDEKQ